MPYHHSRIKYINIAIGYFSILNQTTPYTVANKSACYQPIGGNKFWLRIRKYRYKISTDRADDTRGRTTLI